MKLLIFLFLNLMGFYIFPQDSAGLPRIIKAMDNPPIEQQLDKTLNSAPIFGKATIIYVSNSSVYTDTLSHKFKPVEKDSSILLKFDNKTEKTIKMKELWGLTTDFGERRRLYNGKSLTVWKTSAPYVYKITKRNADYYFFSETLTGKIYLLSPEIISSAITNTQTKQQLLNYIQENNISSKNIRKAEASDILLGTADTLFKVFCGLFDFFILPKKCK